MPAGFRERLKHGLAGWFLPERVRESVPRPVMEAMRGLRARVVSRGLSRRAVFTQPEEQRRASGSISIVVAIHDAPMVTLRCLASLERDAPESEVILVDDGSKLTQTRKIIEEFGGRNGWKVVSNREPRGHSAACVAGAELASRPYVCLLNSDTVVTPWSWRAIAEAFEGDPAIGVAGPSTSFAGNEQTLNVAWCCRLYWNDAQIDGFAERLAMDSAESGLVDLQWIAGFAFFIRRSLWEELGGFDLSLPDYGNEVEFCRRVAEKGLRMVWVRNAYIHHFSQQSYRETIGEDGILLARIRSAQIHNKALIERVEALLDRGLDEQLDEAAGRERIERIAGEMEVELGRVQTQLDIAESEQRLIEKRLREHEETADRWERKAEVARRKQQHERERAARERNLDSVQFTAKFAGLLQGQAAVAEELRSAGDRLEGRLDGIRAECERS